MRGIVGRLIRTADKKQGNMKGMKSMKLRNFLPFLPFMFPCCCVS